MKRPTDLSPREGFERYLNARKTELTDETLVTYRYRLKLFVEWCERQEIETVDELDGWILDQFESVRSGQNVASYTLHNEMDTLQAFIAYLERIEAVGGGLAEKVHVPDVPEDEQSRETKLDAERAIQLLQHYRSSDRYGSKYHALLEVAWNTGARLGGIRALDLRDFDAGEQSIEFAHRPETDTPLKNKLNGERIVGIDEPVAKSVSAYIRTNRADRHDEYGRQPLFSSLQGRPTTNTLRSWMYRATFPCVRQACPHGHSRPTCDFTNHSSSSQCPSSRAPHHVRTGSITWHRDCGVPREVVRERVDASQDVIEKYYDKASKRDRMEQCRRPHLQKLTFE
ncbi:tyrosine-type recombinase/integrase [Natrialbaceae archaeon AArc-T1-2]|uniref:tyrosine-type recombinase/integrase n=1 Tax=Natrialbaceae archaeon AArc-T1-2 TaxID=3053904 RepID=UPI00255ACF6E|nr:site-specific integrase [Natrialbaceae archaeon AArc-T1-2]WIV68434.1 site-specific integrase [Natrialbaceae archaeon AArc-T1-2]